MRIKRLRWLLIVVAVELLAVITIMVWVVVKDDNSAPDKTNTEEIVNQDGTLTASFVTTGFDSPTDIVATPEADDDRLFIVERAGTIKVMNTTGEQADAPFLDITSKVKGGGEMGLLGLAFHPNFASNGYFFVNYTNHNDETIIARYHVDSAGPADPASEKILLTVKQPYANHNGGGLQFGPDGYLYIALGDGGSGGDPENRAQDKTTLLGKILRIDVNEGDPYTVPATNPFVNEQGTRPEIWALGLRNPWRISFDRATGDLWIGDVGQNEYEEIDMQPRNSKGGENYGWRCYEGTHPFNTEGCQDAQQYTQPVLEYDHSEDRCSVTGGFVYRGSRNSSLAGKYLYGDYCSGTIYAADSPNGTWTVAARLDTPYSISTFGQDTAGELYFADIQTGSIYRIGTN